jgi:hypothetical protein
MILIGRWWHFPFDTKRLSGREVRSVLASSSLATILACQPRASLSQASIAGTDSAAPQALASAPVPSIVAPPLVPGRTPTLAARWICASPTHLDPEATQRSEEVPRLLWDPSGTIIACRWREVRPHAAPLLPPATPPATSLSPGPALACSPRLLWSPPAKNPGLLCPSGAEGVVLDATYVYVTQEDSCGSGTRPRYDGGIWRIERTTGHAKRISQTAYEINEMLIDGSVLWRSEFSSYCQRFVHPKDPSWWLVRHPLEGGAERRVAVPWSPEGGSVGAHDLRAGDACLWYQRSSTSDEHRRLESIDYRSMKSTVRAWGHPFVSALVGNFFYFLDPGTKDQVALYRVPLGGGEAELLAEDLTDFLYPRFLRQGDDLLLKTWKRGIRALSVSGDVPVARDLVAGANREWEGIGELAITREAVVYVFGFERSMEIRAVSLRGGPSWQLAPPYRDPRGLVADHRGIYWINLVEDTRNTTGVFACDLPTRTGESVFRTNQPVTRSAFVDRTAELHRLTVFTEKLAAGESVLAGHPRCTQDRQNESAARAFTEEPDASGAIVAHWRE